MPIYEYTCSKCGVTFSLLVLSASSEARPKCPSCGSEDARKNMSSFCCSTSGPSGCGDGYSGSGSYPAGGG